MRETRRVTAALRRWSLGGDLGAWPARGPGASRALATLQGSRAARQVVDRGSGHEIVRDPASWRRPGRRASWEPWRAPFPRAAATLAPETSADGDDAGEEIPRLPRLKRLKVGELRDLLARHGLDESGIRDVLIDRLDRHRDGADQHQQKQKQRSSVEAFFSFFLDAPPPPTPEPEPGLNNGAPGPKERILRPDEHGIDPDLIPKHVRNIARRLRAPMKSSKKPRRRRRWDDETDDDDDGSDSPGGDSPPEQIDVERVPSRTLVVGGAVRDLLMGKTPRDFDLITDATWRQIKRRMGHRAIIVGRRFRVAHVYSADPNDPRADMCELVAMQEHDRVDRAKREQGQGSAPKKGTNRRMKAGRGHDVRHNNSNNNNKDDDDDLDDLLYGDSEAETAAKATDGAHERWLRRLRVNARGRCFTVNAMMYDVETGVLYDFAGGLDDVDAKRVRTVRRPDESFADDPTRMLRAVRVAARHGLAPTREILASMRAHAPSIRTVPPMRVAGEVKTLLSGGYAATSVRMLWETGLLEHVAPAHAQYLAKSVNPDSTFVARTLASGPLDATRADAMDEDGVEGDETPRPWERRRGAAGGGADVGGTGGDGRHRRASKRVSDATTRRLFDRDPLFAVLRALDAFATPSSPVREELVFAALAIPLAIRAVGWPRLPERVPESLKHAAGSSRRPHLAGHSWRRLEAELARYDAWWRSLPPSERASSSDAELARYDAWWWEERAGNGWWEALLKMEEQMREDMIRQGLLSLSWEERMEMSRKFDRSDACKTRTVTRPSSSAKKTTPLNETASKASKTLNETAYDAWVPDWCFWSAAAASAQLALRDYSPSTRGVLFDSFALTHLPALTTQRGATDKDARRRRGRERSNDENVVIELSDADFRKTLPPPLARLARRLAEPARKAKAKSRDGSGDGVSLECSIDVRDALRFLRVVLEARRMCRGTEEEFDEGRYDGPDAVVDEDEPL